MKEHEIPRRDLPGLPTGAHTRRRFVSGSLGLGFAILAGCGGSSGGSGGTAAGTRAAGTAIGKPRRGGVLNIAIPEEPFPKAYDMALVGPSTGTENVAYLAYNGLVNISPEGKVVPELAESFERTDARTFVFHLHEGVEFQDGTKCDAKAVKANFDRLQAPRTKSPRRIPQLESWRVVGPHQIELRLAHPYAAFLTMLRRNKMPIQSPTAWERYAASDSFKASVGTGGYRLVQYRKGDGVSLKRFDGYWKGTNYFDRIEAKIIPSEATRLEALQSGGIQVCQLTAAQLPQLKSAASVQTVLIDTTSVDFLAFNQKRPPFDKREVRQAFSQALDRAGIVEAVYRGQGVQAHGPLAPAYGAAYTKLDDVAAQRYDQAAAKAALRSSGFELAKPVPFASFNESPWGPEADVMQQAFTQIGVKTNLRKTDFPSFAAVFYDQLDYTIGNSQSNGYTDPDEQLTAFYGTRAESTENVANAMDSVMTKLLHAGRITYDEGKRADIYHEAARRAAEQAYYAFVAHPKDIVGLADRVQGFKPRIGGGAWRPVDECWFSS